MQAACRMAGTTEHPRAIGWPVLGCAETCCMRAWQALYRGNGANVLRLVPEVGTSFLLNEQLRIMFTPPDGRPITFEGRLAAGAATGILKVPPCSYHENQSLSTGQQSPCTPEGANAHPAGDHTMQAGLQKYCSAA